eukprot:GILJ01013112.1.p2 GENE.GILJ01013112.1~~GILJ01013112.1.p2  ORF type:complete len:375 (-),score=42.43 GILJ01013112.1:136-1260(-)
MKKRGISIPAESKLVLNEMHAYGHIVPCQRRLRIRRQKGAGLAHGETNESVNSYLGQYAYCTRKESHHNRSDHLFLAVDFWNSQIIEAQAILLAKRIRATQMKFNSASAALRQLAERPETRAPTPEAVRKWVEQEHAWNTQLLKTKLKGFDHDGPDSATRMLELLRININVCVTDVKQINRSLQHKAESAVHVGRLYKLKQSSRRKLNQAKQQYDKFCADEGMSEVPDADALEALFMKEDCPSVGDGCISQAQREYIDTFEKFERCQEELQIIANEIESANRFYNLRHHVLSEQIELNLKQIDTEPAPDARQAILGRCVLLQNQLSVITSHVNTWTALRNTFKAHIDSSQSEFQISERRKLPYMLLSSKSYMSQ